MDKGLCKELGKQFEDRRVSKNFSRNNVARLSCLTYSEYHKIESGAVSKLNPLKVKSICDVLGLEYIEILELIGYIDSNSITKKKSISDDDWGVETDEKILVTLKLKYEMEKARLEEEIKKTVNMSDFNRLTKLSHRRDRLDVKLAALISLMNDLKDLNLVSKMNI